MWLRKKNNQTPIYDMIAERMQYLHEVNTPLRQRVNTPNTNLTTIHWIGQIINDNTILQTTPYFAQDAFLQHLYKEFDLIYDLQFFWPMEPRTS